jgi:hypothetical protein
VHLIAEGDVTLAQMKELLPIYESIIEKHGRLLVLMNLTHIGEVGFETRKCAMDWSKKHGPSVITAVYGASFVTRNVVNFVNRALRAISKDAAPLRYCETEAEARAWLHSQDAQRMQQPHG